MVNGREEGGRKKKERVPVLVDGDERKRSGEIEKVIERERERGQNPFFLFSLLLLCRLKFILVWVLSNE